MNDRNLLVAVLVLVALLFVVPGIGMVGMMAWGMGNWAGGASLPFAGAAIGALVSALVPIVLIVALVVLVTRRQPAAGSDALRILDERYARGEIDHDEYERRRAALRQG